MKLESVRKMKAGPFTELMVVVTPCFPLKVSQSADERNPLAAADEVAMVKVRVFEEVAMESPEAPEVAKVKVGPITPLMVLVDPAPPVPVATAVILPYASTVTLALLYEPAATVVVARAKVDVFVEVVIVICPAVP